MCDLVFLNHSEAADDDDDDDNDMMTMMMTMIMMTMTMIMMMMMMMMLCCLSIVATKSERCNCANNWVLNLIVVVFTLTS